MPATNTTTTKTVTPEQIDAASRIIGPDGKVFYLVQSATDPDVEYKVQAFQASDGKHYLTCTCKAGQRGTPCWHKRAATAHAEEVRATEKALAERNQAEQEQAVKQAKLDRIRKFVELGLTHPQALQASETYTTLSDEDLARTFKVPTRRGPKPKNDTRVFSLMR